MDNFLVHRVDQSGALIGAAYADCEPPLEQELPASLMRSSHEGSIAEREDEAARLRRVADLIAQHRSALLQYLVRILASRQDAEDVFQEACIRLLRVQDLSSVDRYVHAFVFKIATNLAWDCLRRRKVRFHDAHLPYETIETLAEVVEREMEMRVITRALMRLPQRHQRVFTMHVAEGLSYRSIARRLGVSTKTVERDMSAVLKSCQRRLSAGHHN
jgi:RNA polymerase sigma factor (sigma-70 family)